MKTKSKALSPELLRKLDAYWRAANYLSVGQIYLYDNPLLKKPLTVAHIQPPSWIEPGVSGATWLGIPPGNENCLNSRCIPSSSCEMFG